VAPLSSLVLKNKTPVLRCSRHGGFWWLRGCGSTRSWSHHDHGYVGSRRHRPITCRRCGPTGRWTNPCVARRHKTMRGCEATDRWIHPVTSQSHDYQMTTLQSHRNHITSQFHRNHTSQSHITSPYRRFQCHTRTHVSSPAAPSARRRWPRSALRRPGRRHADDMVVSIAPPAGCCGGVAQRRRDGGGADGVSA